MTARKPEPPEAEQRVGIKTYFSDTNGIGGRIKDAPEDFIVEEITPDGRILEVGKSFGDEAGEPKEYTVFTVEKKNWDTIRVMIEIANKCNVSRKRIRFAGMKDRRAIATMRASIWRVPIETLKKLRIRDVELRDFTYSDSPINLGTLKGNRFTVVIEDVAKDADILVRTIVRELDGKCPNFFGLQRFGNRLNTHLVGKSLLRNDFKGAVEHYLCDTGNEPEEATKAREELRNNWDLKAALRNFPKYLGFEKSVLNYLVNNPTDFAGALRKLPKRLRWMFIHAYQGYIFNRSLSAYIDCGEAPKELPLVGFATKQDSVTSDILSEEGIEPVQFRLPSMPEIASPGIMRPCFVGFFDFEVVDFNAEDSNIRLRFSLPSGSYATILLRELMKN